MKETGLLERGTAASSRRRLIGLREATRDWGVSYLTGWRLAKAGTIHSVTIGSRVLIPLAEYERVLSEGAPHRRRASADGEETGLR